ncbi:MULTISPECIES: proline dehydrogenase family protein [unclassified Janibacter]|uniref:proline dehydrogenase family protein n=1 Tax=unclassified Janibacter TaxID=2649294 RepID=UPI003CFD4383
MALGDRARDAVTRLSRNEIVRRHVVQSTQAREVATRFVPGPDASDAVDVAARLRLTNRRVTVRHLDYGPTTAESAAATRDEAVAVLAELSAQGLSEGGWAEVSLSPAALGAGLRDGDRIALDHARTICGAAQGAGAGVTLDAADHTSTDGMFALAEALRPDFPGIGVTVQAQLHRSEADCADLVGEGSRVRLMVGESLEPRSVAWRDDNEAQLAFVRCARLLVAGRGTPMIATHEPRLLEVVTALADHHERQDAVEYQMLCGIRDDAQRRLADAGKRVRVLVPFGDQWYGYLARRVAERPVTAAYFARALATGR